MDLIKEISKWLGPVCITGCAVRAIYCLIVSNYNEDEAAMYKKRAKNAIKFAILAALAETIKQLAEAYFNGGKSI
jgi:PHD/YefM family antitoxin component YafN of YafNO toxin-antitoxin module